MKMNRTTCMKIANLTARGRYEEIVELLSNLNLNDKQGTWGYFANKLIPFLQDRSVKAPHTIFAKGNGKLPFYAFSNLPIVNCPGAGECTKWCYSLKAWRYPAAFFRQVQNTILVREKNIQLYDAWASLPVNVDVRLYVDGDFESLDTMNFWFNRMNDRPDLKVYGYSKSWKLFVDFEDNGGVFPSNYVLNLSSGSRYENIGMIRARMEKMPITRGNFTAVNVEKDSSPKTVREVAKTLGMEKIFVCPGKCGDCIKAQGENAHACGSLDRMKDFNIVIPIH